MKNNRKIKSALFLLFLTYVSISLAQTTSVEAKLLMDPSGDGAATLFSDNYELAEWSQPYKINDDPDREVSFQQVYRPNENTPCATRVSYHKISNDYIEFFILPAPGTNSFIISDIINDWMKRTKGEEYMTRILLFSLLKYDYY